MKHIVPVQTAIRYALARGFNPYDNHADVVRAYARVCQKRGASRT